MLPEQLYITGIGWFAYFIYVPVALVVVGFLYWFILRRIPILLLRLLIAILVSFPILTFPLWEAFKISYEAEKLCKEKAGLHVYKIVETDGFIGSSNIKRWSEHGFSYVESGGGKYMNRRSIKNEEIVIEDITEYSSRYALSSDNYVKLNRSFYYNRSYVEDRQTKEVLGELVIIRIPLSRFDLYAHIPFLGSPVSWACGNETVQGKGSYSRDKKKYLYSYADVIEATLKPMKVNNGEIK